MKVGEVMKRDVTFCTPETDLAAIAALMWQSDCGVIPIMSGERIEGILTDRDVCIALGTRDVPAHTVSAREVGVREVFTCAPDDDVQQALKIMRAHKVRRLPVLNGGGRMVGILSLNEVLRWAHQTARKPADITYEDILNTMKAICEHPVEEAEEPAVEERALVAAAR